LLVSVVAVTWSLGTSKVVGLLEPFYAPDFIQYRNYYSMRLVDANEYQTIWNPAKGLDISLQIEDRSRMSYDPSAGNAEILQWGRNTIEFDTVLRRATSVVIRQFFYPNWRATMDGDVDLPIRLSQEDGLIRLDLPSGRHHVVLRLGPLLSEHVGAAVSIMTVLLLAGWYAYERYQIGSKACCSPAAGG